MCVFSAKSVVRLSERRRRVASAASTGGAIYSGKRVSFILSSAPPLPRVIPARPPESPPRPVLQPVLLLTSSFEARDTTVVRRFLGKLCHARPSGPYAMPATGFVSQDPVAEKTEHGNVFTSK